MNRCIICVAFLALWLISCKKEDTVFNTDLALDSRFIILNAPADTTKIVVYSDHSWTVEHPENASWLTLQQNAGSGTAYAIVAVNDNLSDYPRATTLYFKAGDKTDTLRLGQRGLIVPRLTITAASVNAPALGGNIQTAITTTLPLDALSPAYSYSAGSDWISGLQVVEGKLLFNVAANESAASRSAKIYLSYADLLGTNLKDSLVVNQPRP
ncbi:BACON domain-containing protein [Niabella insulamsoli]|uniref:BACON domain-containing protein n=1 Tax=Niabella insulamsoli TaxID=3144874 RepID=UPI0031FDD264